jgi:TRAP-type C4-dicarboxylate transport system substrate-binding protein
LGVTYDYYTVSKATAKTYMNAAHYTDLYNVYTDALANNSLTDYQKAILEDEVDKIEEYKAANWVLEDKDEIKSIYKAMGIRAGINVKF